MTNRPCGDTHEEGRPERSGAALLARVVGECVLGDQAAVSLLRKLARARRMTSLALRWCCAA